MLSIARLLQYIRIPKKLQLDERGVAAVEFALILPIMLLLYLSTVIATKGYNASRKISMIARALSDVTSQAAKCPSNANYNVCVTASDLDDILSAGASILAPYDPASLTMAISRVDILEDSTNAYWAFTKWTAVYINDKATQQPKIVARPCDGGNSSFNTSANNTLNSSYSPGGNLVSANGSSYNHPLNAQDGTAKDANYQKNLAVSYTQPSAASGNAPVASSLIVADVAYIYSPGFSFNIGNWRNATAVPMVYTQAFWSRSGSPITFDPGTTSVATMPIKSTMANITLCPNNDPTQP